MAYTQGIGIQLPFVLDAKAPLDARSIVANMTELNAISDLIKYNGMRVYVESEDKDYRWKASENDGAGAWVEIKYTADESVDTGSTVTAGSVTMLEPGEAARVENSGTNKDAIFNFYIPKGDTGAAGADGADGAAATVAVGTVSTGAAGSAVTVTNSGTENAAVLDFSIPKGADGAAATVEVGSVVTGDPDSEASVTNSGTENAAVLDFSIPAGKAATIAVGTVTTGAAGSDVVITNVGTASEATLNFTIPRGEKGEKGDAFTVTKIYSSVAEMEADYEGSEVQVGQFVIISTDVNNEENGKLYCKGTTAYEFICDLSGSIGADGADGQAATITIGTVTTVSSDQEASVVNVGTDTDAVLNFVIPRGADGADGQDGADGEAATIEVGTVTTGDPGTAASVTNVGTANAAVFDIVIPRGADGATGADGADGEAATIEVGSVTTGDAGTEVEVTNSGTENAAVLNFVIPRGTDGADGADGEAATIEVGTVTTGAAGSAATVTNSGTVNAAKLDFVIPKGDKGEDGDKIRVGTDYSTATEETVFFRVISTITE